MKERIDIALYSLDTFWQNPTKTFERIRLEVKDLETDILILPEMFSTGYSMDVNAVAETHNGATVFFMKNMSSQLDSVICGSVPIQENNQYYNRFYWVEPNGTILSYDKRHLFSYAGEDKIYTSGHRKTIIEYKGWTICPLICYDLRFPVWSRNVEMSDLYIYVANWPTKRDDAWRTLLKARAIENLSYVAGVNRSGTDGNRLEYSGFSTIFGPLGNQLESRKHSDSITVYKISRLELKLFRERFQFLNDKDDFKIIP